MNNNENFVITINREVGSGGRTVGRKLAEQLNMKYYDKALVKGLTEKYHLSIEEIERMKAADKSNSWWDEFNRFYHSFVGGSSEKEEPTTAAMFETERRIYEELAMREPCVVAGRSAFLVFRDWPNHLNVFIQASLSHRLDAGREAYIKKYSDRSRYDTRNYQLVISMDNLSEEDAVNVIMAYVKGIMK